MSIIADPEREFVLSVTENGYGKRTSVSDYRQTGRGGQGVANIETSDRNGRVMASFTVVEEDQLMLVTNHGQVIRIRVHGGEGDSIRVAGRKTQGVRLFDVSGDEEEKVVSAGLIKDADDDDDVGEESTADNSEEVQPEISDTDPNAETAPSSEGKANEPDRYLPRHSDR